MKGSASTQKKNQRLTQQIKNKMPNQREKKGGRSSTGNCVDASRW